MTRLCLRRDSFIWVPWLIRVRHDSLICNRARILEVISVPWLDYVCAVTHLYECHDWVRHNSFICNRARKLEVMCVPWLIRIHAVTHPCMPWLIHVCHDSTPSCVIAPPHTRGSMCAMTHLYLCHDSSIRAVTVLCVPWPVQTWSRPHTQGNTCTVTHLYLCCDSFLCVPWLIYACHDWSICAMTRSDVITPTCLE